MGVYSFQLVLRLFCLHSRRAIFADDQQRLIDQGGDN